MASLTRVKQMTIDKDGDIVIAIEKYNFLECLFHSIYGVMTVLLVVGAIILISYSYIILTIVAIVISMFLWVVSWLNANDVLKQRIYTTVLLDYLKDQTTEEQEPMAAKFYSDSELVFIKCVACDGSVVRYEVEFIMEKLPLYVVKIHTQPLKN